MLIELDREKLQYNLDKQKAALARALAKYGATEPGHLPPIEQTPDVQKAAAELAQAKQAFERARGAAQAAAASRSRRSTTPTRRCARSRRPTTRRCRTPRTSRADIDASNAMLKLADRQLRDATIRAPFDGYVQKRLVSLGEFVKSQTPVMSIVRVDPLKAIGEIPERMAPWVQVGQPVTLRVDAYPGQDDHRHRVAHQSGRQHADPRVSVRSARAQRRRPAEAGHVCARARGDLAGRTGADDPVRRHAVPLRRLPGVRRQRRPARRCAS